MTLLAAFQALLQRYSNQENDQRRHADCKPQPGRD
jgi:hypothetical protein